jgi:DHA3 family macrolide efflux protein-like MFS transporter
MRRLWYAQVISLFGDFLALFTVIAVVSFTMNRTAAQLTGLQIAYMVPIVFVGPIAGVFVDRWPLKPTLVSSDLVRACLAMLLIVATTVPQVFLVLPAQTLIQRETPPDMLGRVQSTNASVISLGQILGLAVSGILAECVGMRTVFFLCAALSVALAASGRVFLRRGGPSARFTPATP